MRVSRVLSSSVSRFPVKTVEQLPTDLRDRLLEVQSKAGFVPNVFLALSHRPNELRAFMNYHDEVMRESGGLTKAEKEMIVVATSGANRCLYCVVAHGAILRIYAKNKTIADSLALEHSREPSLTPKQTAMLDYALKLARTPEHAATKEDLQTLTDAGFSNEGIWDISSIVAFFAMSNRLATACAIEPNLEFYTMGRVDRPKKKD